MAETIRDVVIKVKLLQEDVKLKVPDTKPASDAFDKLGDDIKEPFEKADKAIEEIEKELEKLEDDLDNLGDNETLEKLEQDGIGAAEGFKTAGEGAFTLLRGMTLLGISAEDDMAKVVAQVAKAQAAFDLFKGSTDVVKGLVEGSKALGIALNPMAAAGVAAAAAIGALAFALNSVDSDPIKEITEELKNAEDQADKTIAKIALVQGTEAELADKILAAELALIRDPQEQLRRLERELQATRAQTPDEAIQAGAQPSLETARQRRAQEAQDVEDARRAPTQGAGRLGQNLQRQQEIAKQQEELEVAEAALRKLETETEERAAQARLRQLERLEALQRDFTSRAVGLGEDAGGSAEFAQKATENLIQISTVVRNLKIQIADLTEASQQAKEAFEDLTASQ